jgi:hypothetical protein
MRHEGVAITRRKSSHFRGDRIALLLEEAGEITGDYIAQMDGREHEKTSEVPIDRIALPVALWQSAVFRHRETPKAAQQSPRRLADCFAAVRLAVTDSKGVGNKAVSNYQPDRLSRHTGQPVKASHPRPLAHPPLPAGVY